jgi:hypothetical protein
MGLENLQWRWCLNQIREQANEQNVVDTDHWRIGSGLQQR